ncbi:MAG: putative glycoside hydrolase [Candidatus Zambryskibacteria bacterium]
MRNVSRIIGIFIGGTAMLFLISSFVFSSEVSYQKDTNNLASTAVQIKEVKHLKTPEPLKGIYMTQCVASMPSFREKLAKLIDETELNSVVIDIKDYTGTISFKTGNPEIDVLSGSGCKVSDMQDFVDSLHDKNIYVIGRVTVFQDPLYVKAHSELAVKKKSDGGIWKDRKGISFIDVGAKPFWDYVISIATSSYAIGFDEINFDYIRFPSDGDMKDILFPYTGTTAKKEMLRQFFSYLDSKIAGTGIVTSADLFGMTTANIDDLNIGQVLEYALENFDYVAPMVYPSHYPPTFNGWPDPNKVPYEIVKFSLDAAVARNKFLYSEISTSTASTTPNLGLMKRINPLQLRPWLQDNDYPVHYTPAMVRAQIQATYDAGLTSWMLWDPANTYTKEALLP